LRLASRRSHTRERSRGERAARPGAEVLRGEFFAGDLAEVFVHVAGADRARLVVLVEIPEELLPRELLTLPHDPREPTIAELRFARLAALTDEAEAEPLTLHPHVTIAQRRRAVRTVLPRVLAIADAHLRSFEQAHDRGEDLLAW